jgi:hypothetical protein
MNKPNPTETPTPLTHIKDALGYIEHDFNNTDTQDRANLKARLQYHLSRAATLLEHSDTTKTQPKYILDRIRDLEHTQAATTYTIANILQNLDTITARLVTDRVNLQQLYASFHRHLAQDDQDTTTPNQIEAEN